MMKKIAVFLTFVLAMPLLADATPDGGAIFKSKCAMCHGPDGSGQTAMGRSLKLRDLGSADVQRQTDAQLIAIVADGKEKMPAYKGKLSPDEISQLVAHIRTLRK